MKFRSETMKRRFPSRELSSHSPAAATVDGAQFDLPGIGTPLNPRRAKSREPQKRRWEPECAHALRGERVRVGCQTPCVACETSRMRSPLMRD